MASLRALPILCAADHQLIKPARERRPESELRETAGQLDTGLLGDIFRVGAVTTPFPGNAIHRVVVQIQQLREGCDISILRTLYETCEMWVVHWGFFVGRQSLDGVTRTKLGQWARKARNRISGTVVRGDSNNQGAR